LDAARGRRTKTKTKTGLGGFCVGEGRRGMGETKGRSVGMERWRRKDVVEETVRRCRRWWKEARRDFWVVVLLGCGWRLGGSVGLGSLSRIVLQSVHCG
jgi:hypothetical protein